MQQRLPLRHDKAAAAGYARAMSQITPEIVATHGFTPEEYKRVLAAMGREPNLLELGIFSVMWSEHCSYKSSRMHLAKLPTKAPWVICGPVSYTHLTLPTICSV